MAPLDKIESVFPDVTNWQSLENKMELSNPYQIHLIFLISILAVILFLMILCVILPKSMNWLLCFCYEKKKKFNYVDMALYKTRHSMYRKEVYSANMRKSLFPQVSNSESDDKNNKDKEDVESIKTNTNQEIQLDLEEELKPNKSAPTVIIQLCMFGSEDHRHLTPQTTRDSSELMAWISSSHEATKETDLNTIKDINDESHSAPENNEESRYSETCSLVHGPSEEDDDNSENPRRACLESLELSHFIDESSSTISASR